MLFALIPLLLASTFAAAATPPPAITVRGNHFVVGGSAERFTVKGVAYQPRYRGPTVDPISNAAHAAWSRDLPLIAALGANLVRVYDIDPNQQHDQFMAALAEQNMYLLLDLASDSGPSSHINRDSPSYSLALQSRYLDVVDAFAGYSNVFGFIVGNEVSGSSERATRAAPMVRALVRDMRQYMSATGKRAVPLGYAASDNADTRVSEMHYYTCGSSDSAVDFFGHNLYSWCADNATFPTSGYADRLAEFKTLGVPVVLSEFGCNVIRPRSFPDVPSIYGPDMNAVVAGAIAYEWSEENNGYGLVSIKSASDATVTKLPDYDALKAQWLTVIRPLQTLPGKSTSGAKGGPRPQCPTVNTAWQAAASPLPPTPSACTCEKEMQRLAFAECRASLPSNTTDVEKSTFLANVCGMAPCGDIGSLDDPSRGIYGKLGPCSLDTKIAWVLDAYYVGHGKVQSACDWGGRGILVPGVAHAASPQSSASCQDRIVSPKDAPASAKSASLGHQAASALALAWALVSAVVTM
ncbi:Glucanosyltransferase-domain-containing protein [Blastocladiella britannica]|nr:Glucanosyltransferase-domain-containing protein [Blastocladiella britannica]